MAGITRPFIPWIGSKEKLIPYIWQVFPPRPKLYLEPFGGGGALLLGMQPKISRMDIYNDFNCDLVNLFLCARECTIQLVQELKFLPLHSRAEFDLLKEFMKHKELLQQRIANERNAVMECFSGEEREELLQILRERSCLFDVQRAAAYAPRRGKAWRTRPVWTRRKYGPDCGDARLDRARRQRLDDHLFPAS